MQTAGVTVTCVAAARQSRHQKASHRRHATWWSNWLAGQTLAGITDVWTESDRPRVEIWHSLMKLALFSASIYIKALNRIARSQFRRAIRIPHTALASTVGLDKAFSRHTNWLVWHGKCLSDLCSSERHWLAVQRRVSFGHCLTITV